MRTLAPLAFLLLAGCGAPGGPPEDPALACAQPPETGAACPYLMPTPACARLALDVRDDRGAWRVVARVTNACERPMWIQGTHQGDAEREGMRAWLALEGDARRYWFASGSATASPVVLPLVPPGRVVEPGATMEAAWPWNGTIEEAGEGGLRHAPAPPGGHKAVAEIVRAPDVRAEANVTME